MLQRNNLFLDNRSGELDIKTIKKAHSDGMIQIANILWDPVEKSCYIKTFRDSFQNNIVSYEEFVDFIYLVDEAFYEIESVHRKEIK